MRRVELLVPLLRWAWVIPIVSGGVLAIIALASVRGTHTSLPGNFAEAQAFVDRVEIATDSALTSGDTRNLALITTAARQAAAERGAVAREALERADVEDLLLAIEGVADAADSVAQGRSDRSSLDFAIRGLLEQSAQLQSELLQENAASLRRLRETSTVLVVVMLLGAVAAAAAMYYSDRSLRRMRRRERDAAALVEAKNEELATLLRHDPLTGLLNRGTLLADIPSSRNLPPGRNILAVVYVDLDRFKVANDALGHRVGDALLVQVAERMQRVWPAPELVARLGGDEFGLALYAVDQAEVVDAVTRLTDAFAMPMNVEGFVLDVPASIGFAITPDDGLTTELLLHNADLAMFAAKQQGGRSARRFTPEMDQTAADRSAVEGGLRIAVAQHEFRLVYQPVVQARTGKIESVEALLRWDHPERGTLLPGDFIGVAEDSGLIAPIGDWVLEEALDQLGRWQRKGLGISVAVNLSPRQLLLPGLAGWVLNLARRHGASVDGLILEITETATMDLEGSAYGELEELRAAGVRIALDDFGVGYSSLGRFNTLPLDVVKIDREFLSTIANPGAPTPREIAVMEAAVLLAHSRGLPVVAEGVETASERSLIVRLGCDLAQGFLFSRPVPPGEIERFVATPEVAAA